MTDLLKPLHRLSTPRVISCLSLIMGLAQTIRVLFWFLIIFHLFSCMTTPLKEEGLSLHEPLSRRQFQFQFKEKEHVQFSGEALWWQQGQWGRWDIYGAFRVLAGQIYYSQKSVFLLNHLEKYYVEINLHDSFEWRNKSFNPRELIAVLSQGKEQTWQCSSHAVGKECHKGDIQIIWHDEQQLEIISFPYALQLLQKQTQILKLQEHPHWFQVQIPRHYPRKRLQGD